MERRRFFALALSTIAAAALAGCGGSGPDQADGPTEITYWLWQDDATDTTWDELAAEFNATHPDVRVTLQTIPLDQYQDRLTTAVASGSGPDAARSKDWWLGQLADEGVLTDLRPFVERWTGRDDVMEPLWATGQVPGGDEIYMLPHQYVTLYLYYRKDLFAQAGLEPPKTQADVLEAARVLTDPGQGRYGMDL